MTQPSSRSYDTAVVELLRHDPAFADDYLSAALDEADQPGGHEALMAVLRHIAEVCRRPPARFAEDL